jgi:hypothetical protein
MSSIVRILLFLVLLAAAGCQPAQPGGSNEGMREVLGALQVHGVKPRDQALASSCRNAAEHGFGEAVLIGVPRIESKPLRDEVAADCALRLHEKKQPEAAGNVAKLIGNPTARGDVLSKLNTGS